MLECLKAAQRCKAEKKSRFASLGNVPLSFLRDGKANAGVCDAISEVIGTSIKIKNANRNKVAKQVSLDLSTSIHGKSIEKPKPPRSNWNVVSNRNAVFFVGP